MYRLIRLALALAFVLVMAVLMLAALVGVYALAAWMIGG